MFIDSLMQKRESPDFRFPGVGISAASVVPWLMASCKVPMDIYVEGGGLAMLPTSSAD